VAGRIAVGRSEHHARAADGKADVEIRVRDKPALGIEQLDRDERYVLPVLPKTISIYLFASIPMIK
jgi:anti-sigma factor RsiW